MLLHPSADIARIQHLPRGSHIWGENVWQKQHFTVQHWTNHPMTLGSQTAAFLSMFFRKWRKVALLPPQTKVKVPEGESLTPSPSD